MGAFFGCVPVFVRVYVMCYMYCKHAVSVRIYRHGCALQSQMETEEDEGISENMSLGNDSQSGMSAGSINYHS